MSRRLACAVHLWPPPGHARQRGEGARVLAQAGPRGRHDWAVFPEDSWVQVRYPLTSEQEHADRAGWPWLPGWVVASAARMSGRSACRPRNWPPGTRARPGTRPVSGTPPRSACPKRRRTWNGLPGPNWRRNEHHAGRARPARDHPRRRRAARHRRAPPGRGRTRPRLGADRGGGVAARADRRRRAVRLVQRPVRLHLHRPPPGRGQRDRGAAAGPADDRVHPARARPVPGGQVRPGRAGPDPGLRRRVVVHERVGRRRGQPAVGRRVRGRPGRAGRGGGPGRGGDPPPRPSRPRTLGLEHRGRAAAAAARIAGLVLLYCLRFALAAPETARGLRRMVLDAAPLPRSPDARAGGDRAAPHQEGRPARPVPRPPRLRGPQQASRVAAELAAQAGLQAGTARSYLYAELDGRAS